MKIFILKRGQKVNFPMGTHNGSSIIKSKPKVQPSIVQDWTIVNFSIEKDEMEIMCSTGSKLTVSIYGPLKDGSYMFSNPKLGALLYLDHARVFEISTAGGNLFYANPVEGQSFKVINFKRPKWGKLTDELIKERNSWIGFSIKSAESENKRVYVKSGTGFELLPKDLKLDSIGVWKSTKENFLILTGEIKSLSVE